jgi:hypothetical protein
MKRPELNTGRWRTSSSGKEERIEESLKDGVERIDSHLIEEETRNV